MQNKLNNKFLWVKNTEIQNLIKALSYKNHIFAFVGGCVRDSLLNLPVNDIDIASSFTPEENMAILTQLGYVVADAMQSSTNKPSTDSTASPIARK